MADGYVIKSVLNRRLIASWGYLITTGLGGAITTAVAARFLAPSTAGIWFTLQSFTMFIALAELGTLLTATRKIAFIVGAAEHSHNDNNAFSTSAERTGVAGVSDIVEIVRYLRRITLTVCCLLAIILGGMLVGQLGKSIDRKIICLTWAFCLFGTIIQICTTGSQAALEGVGKFEYERITALIVNIIATSMMVAAILIGGSLIGMSIAWALGTFILFLAMKYTLGQAIPNMPAPVPGSWSVAKSLLLDSIPIWIVSVGALATRWAQIPMITLYLGPEILPSYFFIYKVLNLGSTALGAFVTADRALFSQDLSAGRFHSALAKAVRYLTILSGGSIFMSASVISLGSVVIRWWLPSSTPLSTTTICLLSIDAGVLCFCTGMGQMVIASGRNPFVISTISSGVATIVLAAALLPSMGIAGAALSSLAAGIFTNYWKCLTEGTKLIGYLRIRSRGERER